MKVVIGEASLIHLELHGINTLTYHGKFFDDFLLICVTLDKEAHAFKEILHEESHASNTHIKNAKTHIFFFNSPLEVQRHISFIRGFPRSSLSLKYINIPLIHNDLGNSSWEGLFSSLKNNLSYWTFRCFNLSNRIILIKVILQDIPIYIFSILNTPKYIIKKIYIIQQPYL